jgi:hypothetical protein
MMLRWYSAKIEQDDSRRDYCLAFVSISKGLHIWSMGARELTDPVPRSQIMESNCRKEEARGSRWVVATS